jgi:hypothetical protein
MTFALSLHARRLRYVVRGMDCAGFDGWSVSRKSIAFAARFPLSIAGETVRA